MNEQTSGSASVRARARIMRITGFVNQICHRVCTTTILNKRTLCAKNYELSCSIVLFVLQGEMHSRALSLNIESLSLGNNEHLGDIYSNETICFVRHLDETNETNGKRRKKKMRGTNGCYINSIRDCSVLFYGHSHFFCLLFCTRSLSTRKSPLVKSFHNELNCSGFAHIYGKIFQNCNTKQFSNNARYASHFYHPRMFPKIQEGKKLNLKYFRK